MGLGCILSQRFVVTFVEPFGFLREGGSNLRPKSFVPFYNTAKCPATPPRLMSLLQVGDEEKLTFDDDSDAGVSVSSVGQALCATLKTAVTG